MDNDLFWPRSVYSSFYLAKIQNRIKQQFRNYECRENRRNIENILYEGARKYLFPPCFYIIAPIFLEVKKGDVLNNPLEITSLA